MAQIGGAALTFKFKYDEITRSHQKLKKDVKKALAYTVKDMKRGAPGWVASAVSDEYNIAKGRVMPTRIVKGKAKSTNKKQPIGSVRVQGDSLEEITLVYTGEVTTPRPDLFALTPRSLNPRRRYTTSMTVFKGRKKALGKYSPNRQRGGPWSQRTPAFMIPLSGSLFAVRRMSPDRMDIKKVTTLSLPQMVDNPEVRTTINDRINEELQKKVEQRLSKIVK